MVDGDVGDAREEGVGGRADQVAEFFVDFVLIAYGETGYGVVGVAGGVRDYEFLPFQRR